MSVDLLPVDRPDPARHVPVAAVSGVHRDAVMISRHYPALDVPNDTAIVRLHVDDRDRNTRHHCEPHTHTYISLYVYLYVCVCKKIHRRRSIVIGDVSERPRQRRFRGRPGKRKIDKQKSIPRTSRARRCTYYDDSSVHFGVNFKTRLRQYISVSGTILKKKTHGVDVVFKTAN